ncbi:hypothetical protein GCM10009555_036610 [Acrocarpospora macrocephala]|uniref:Uncharacterized protein n=1 Tax=Acrocarpospora macrocephala TaxID=150177 RepID=A0A5M3WY77_9ACTN|nr:hypothetical protein Amac_068190 [Acrocarpospora macrocephala]
MVADTGYWVIAAGSCYSVDDVIMTSLGDLHESAANPARGEEEHGEPGLRPVQGLQRALARSYSCFVYPSK